jgi:hypothetical protein
MILSRILQWNMNAPSCAPRKLNSVPPAVPILRVLVDECKHPDLLLLQEAPPQIDTILRKLDYAVWRRDGLVTAVFPASTWNRERSVAEDYFDRALTVGVRNSRLPKRLLVIWNVHLKSRMGGTQDETIEDRCTRLLREFLRTRENGLGSASEVVGGDFNLQPFSKVLLLPPPSGFGGGRCLQTCLRRLEREGADLRSFMNTAWPLVGRLRQPCASYFSDNSNIDAPWYQYDQVLISPDLAQDRAIKTRLIRRTKALSLATNGKYLQARKASASDHYPVLVTLQQEAV